MNKRHITYVKKIMTDGSPCKKCIEVEQRLRETGQIDYIDAIVIADENDPNSKGMQIAQQFQVEAAPFFMVEEPGQATQIYTIYLKFVKEVLKQAIDEKEELKEIIKNHNDLDFL